MQFIEGAPEQEDIMRSDDKELADNGGEHFDEDNQSVAGNLHSLQLADKDSVTVNHPKNDATVELQDILLLQSINALAEHTQEDFRGTVASMTVKSVDTTGAGDAFVGGMLHQIANEPTALQDETRLREVLRFANACGAITTTRKGAIPAMPNMAEALAFMQSA